MPIVHRYFVASFEEHLSAAAHIRSAFVFDKNVEIFTVFRQQEMSGNSSPPSWGHYGDGTTERLE